MFGPSLYISDFNLGILYFLAVSSISTYGILIAGWSANSKYAFLGSIFWPMKKENFSVEQTICGKLINYILSITVNAKLRSLFFTCKLNTLLIFKNPQVTKMLSSVVGTSETVRLLYTGVINKESRGRGRPPVFKVLNNSFMRNKAFKEWLAGLIDGDGCFYMFKSGYVSLEITMDIKDFNAIEIIKNVYGGSIKYPSGKKAVRYCLRHKSGFLDLVNDVNGLIRNSNRLVQLEKVLRKYGITLIYPDKLTYENGWFSGFFEGCGYLNIKLGPPAVFGLTRSPAHAGERLVDNKPQLIISLIYNNYHLVVFYKDIFGGDINLDRNGRYVWSICSLNNRGQVLKFLEYVKKYTLRSHRHKRFFLAPQFFELIDLKAHLAAPQNSMLGKAWSIFNNKFNHYIHTTSISYSNKTLDKLRDSNCTTSKNLIVWGSFIGSSIGSGKLTRQVLEMYKLSNYQYSIVVGILLSDGCLIMGKGAVNPRLGFKQSLDKSSYVWNVFLILSPFCQSLPNLVVGKRNNKLLYGLNFFTRSLPCLKELYLLFYCKNKKIIPENIYHLLTPPALAQWIMGDGQRKESGLVLCTDSYTIKEVVFLVNVLIIRYNLICTIWETNIGQYRIYITQKSMDNLRAIILPHMQETMLYKLNIHHKKKISWDKNFYK